MGTIVCVWLKKHKNLGDDIYKNMSRDTIIKQLTQAQQKESRQQLKIDTEQIKQFKVSFN